MLKIKFWRNRTRIRYIPRDQTRIRSARIRSGLKNEPDPQHCTVRWVWNFSFNEKFNFKGNTITTIHPFLYVAVADFTDDKVALALTGARLARLGNGAGLTRPSRRCRPLVGQRAGRLPRQRRDGDAGRSAAHPLLTLQIERDEMVLLDVLRTEILISC